MRAEDVVKAANEWFGREVDSTVDNLKSMIVDALRDNPTIDRVFVGDYSIRGRESYHFPSKPQVRLEAVRRMSLDGFDVERYDPSWWRSWWHGEPAGYWFSGWRRDAKSEGPYR